MSSAFLFRRSTCQTEATVRSAIISVVGGGLAAGLWGGAPPHTGAPPPKNRPKTPHPAGHAPAALLRAPVYGRDSPPARNLEG